MRRELALAAAVFALAGCRAYAPFLATEGGAMPEPTATVSGDCDTTSVRTEGWPAGTSISFGLGSAPPAMFPANETRTFDTPTDGGGWTVVAIRADGTSETVGTGVVECEPETC